MKEKGLKLPLAVCFLSLLLYLPILFGFFQQDEWLGYARHILLEDNSLTSLLSYAFTPSSGHYIPLTLLTVFGLFSLFHLNYTIFALLSISLHIFAVFLVYKLGRSLFNKQTSLIAALIFGSLASPYQATSWVVADIGTHMSTIFALLSLIFFVYLIKRNNSKLVLPSIVFLIVSLLFKELAIGLLAIYPPLLFIVKKDKKLSVLFAMLGIIYLVGRVVMVFNAPSINEPLGGVVSGSKTIYNILTSPPRTIVELIIPQPAITKVSYTIAKFLPEAVVGEQGTPTYDIRVTKIISESVIAGIFLVLFYFFIRKWSSQKKDSRNHLTLAILFIFINSLIYAIAQGKANERIIFVDPRNLYFGAVFGSLLLAKLLHKKILLVALFVVWNIFWLEHTLLPLAQTGASRLSILNDIKAYYPQLPNKTIFYTESDTSYYGLPANQRILPFQSGFGQTLLSWYSQSNNFPKIFFQDRFLWEITEEGYREEGSMGFGYFKTFENLAKVIDEKRLPVSTVIGLRYSSKSEIVTPMTEEIKGRLEGYLSAKKAVLPGDIEINVSYNPKEVMSIQDRNKETFWSSGIPYSNPQEIKLALSKPKRITQITIDSHTNKDQNEVGYAIATSSDNSQWSEVMRVERISPDSTGLINLYLPPREVQNIVISQIGFHEYASWVVHELTLYESQSQ